MGKCCWKCRRPAAWTNAPGLYPAYEPARGHEPHLPQQQNAVLARVGESAVEQQRFFGIAIEWFDGWHLRRTVERYGGAPLKGHPNNSHAYPRSWHRIATSPVFNDRLHTSMKG